MNKGEFIEWLAKDQDITKADARRIFEAIFGKIVTEVAAEHKINIVGFGTFDVSHRAERKGRNPQTGADITIAPRTAPVFHAGKLFKDAVKG